MPDPASIALINEVLSSIGADPVADGGDPVQALFALNDDIWWNPAWITEPWFIAGLAALPPDRTEGLIQRMFDAIGTIGSVAVLGFDAVLAPASMIPAIKALDKQAVIVVPEHDRWTAQSPWPERVVGVSATGIADAVRTLADGAAPEWHDAPSVAIDRWQELFASDVYGRPPAMAMAWLTQDRDPIAFLERLIRIATGDAMEQWSGEIVTGSWQAAVSPEGDDVILGSGWMPAIISGSGGSPGQMIRGTPWLVAEMALLQHMHFQVAEAPGGIRLHTPDGAGWLAAYADAAGYARITNQRMSVGLL